MVSAKRRVIAPLLCLCLSAALPVVSQSHAPEAEVKVDVGAIVDRAAKDFFKAAPQAVGVSIGVLKDGKMYTYNYGTRDKKGSEHLAENSVYEIASITKTFTGTLLAQAAIEKKASLDDDVRKYLEGDYPNLEFQGHPIRLEQLVNHLSGLPFNLPDIPETRPPFPTPIPHSVEERLDRYTRKDFLADLHQVKLAQAPGEKMSYSNSAAVLASIILERIYGKPYDDIVKEKITGPLQMADTSISLSPSQKARLVKGYDEKGNTQPYVRDMMLGAASLKSTTADLLKYAQWHMAETDEAVKLTHKATFTYNNYSVGLNWQMIKAGEYRRIWQEGSLPGFSSMCVFFPESKIAIVFLANELDPASSHALTLMSDQIAKQLDPRTVPLF